MSTLDRIIFLIDSMRLSNAEVAKQLNLNAQVVTDWKNGKSHSYKKYLYQLANILDTTVEYLKGETDEKRKTAGKPDGISEDEINALDKALDGLTAEELQQVLKYAEFLKQQHN